MKSSLMKLNHVSTFSGKGQLVIISTLYLHSRPIPSPFYCWVVAQTDEQAAPLVVVFSGCFFLTNYSLFRKFNPSQSEFLSFKERRYKVMEFILIHKPRGIFSPEVATATIEQVRKLLAKPDDFVPGGKLIASYAARGKSFTLCIWDAPSAEALCPFIEQLALAGWDTDIMPAEKMTVHIEKLAKALKAKKG
jgi:hypothetical protein